MIFAWLVASRAVHFAACLLIVGTLGVDRLIVAPVGGPAAQRWRGITRWLLWLAFPAALLSGVSWFGAIAADMSGLPPAQALAPPILQLVWSQTHFGRLFGLRLILWIAAALLVIAKDVVPLKTVAAWLALVGGAALSISLAWAGHGLVGDPPRWHLLADSVHLLVAGFWPAGLLPFALLIARLLREPQPRNLRSIFDLTHRFSAMSLLCVALLAASGLGNSWFLVGSVSRLWRSEYGNVLLIKLALFVVMIAIGAINLLRHKPRSDNFTSATRLRRNVAIEATLGAAIVIVIAILGLLEPPACH